jgi:L-lysine exporter family protein LysE/ArgO
MESGSMPPAASAAMLAAASEGFLLGASLIVAIGAQNAFVLRQGLKRRFVLLVCLVCALADAALIIAGVAGLGRLVAGSQTLIRAVSLLGAIFLFVYGLIAFRRAWRGDARLKEEGDGGGLLRTLATCLGFTFLNPHVYLDTVLLLGSLAGRHFGAARIAYAGGAILASFVWFFGLGYGARLLAPVFARPSAWRVLDVGIGGTMWAIAAKLVLGSVA